MPFKPFKDCEYTGEPVAPIVYDNIVRREDFKKGNDAERNRRLGEGSVGSGQGLYDYPDGKIPEDDPATPVIVALRSGQLDKADVDELKKAADESAASEAKSKADKAAIDEAAKVNAARQSYLDEKTGFVPESSSS